MNKNFLVVMMIAGTAFAAPIWNTAADLTGSRTGPSELVAGGNYTTNTVVSWQIGKDPIQTNLWRYTYTFSNFPNPGISHFSLEFSNNCTQANSQAEPCFLHNYTQPMGIFNLETAVAQPAARTFSTQALDNEAHGQTSTPSEGSPRG